MLLYEQYRPQNWEDVKGQDAIVARIAMMRKRGLAGKAYFLTGASGSGKTTIARLIGKEIADDFMVREVDAPGLSVADLDEIERSASVFGWGQKTGRVFILNEAHALRAACVDKLLTMLERIPSHVAFIFTTTSEGALDFNDSPHAKAFLSRCVRLDLARRDLAKPFAERLREIALAEGFGDISPEKALKAVQIRFNNLRACLMALESGELA